MAVLRGKYEPDGRLPFLQNGKFMDQNNVTLFTSCFQKLNQYALDLEKGVLINGG